MLRSHTGAPETMPSKGSESWDVLRKQYWGRPAAFHQSQQQPSFGPNHPHQVPVMSVVRSEVPQMVVPLRTLGTTCAVAHVVPSAGPGLANLTPAAQSSNNGRGSVLANLQPSCTAASMSSSRGGRELQQEQQQQQQRQRRVGVPCSVEVIGDVGRKSAVPSIRTMPDVRGCTQPRVVPGTGLEGVGAVADGRQPRSRSCDERRPACTAVNSARIAQSGSPTPEDLSGALKEMQEAHGRDVAELEQMLQQESAEKAALSARLAMWERFSPKVEDSMSCSLETTIDVRSDASTICVYSPRSSASSPTVVVEAWTEEFESVN